MSNPGAPKPKQNQVAPQKEWWVGVIEELEAVESVDDAELKRLVLEKLKKRVGFQDGESLLEKVRQFTPTALEEDEGVNYDNLQGAAADAVVNHILSKSKDVNAAAKYDLLMQSAEMVNVSEFDEVNEIHGAISTALSNKALAEEVYNKLKSKLFDDSEPVPEYNENNNSGFVKLAVDKIMVLSEGYLKVGADADEPLVSMGPVYDNLQNRELAYRLDLLSGESGEEEPDEKIGSCIDSFVDAIVKKDCKSAKIAFRRAEALEASKLFEGDPDMAQKTNLMATRVYDLAGPTLTASSQDDADEQGDNMAQILQYQASRGKAWEFFGSFRGSLSKAFGNKKGREEAGKPKFTLLKDLKEDNDKVPTPPSPPSMPPVTASTPPGQKRVSVALPATPSHQPTSEETELNAVLAQLVSEYNKNDATAIAIVMKLAEEQRAVRESQNITKGQSLLNANGEMAFGAEKLKLENLQLAITNIKVIYQLVSPGEAVYATIPPAQSQNPPSSRAAPPLPKTRIATLEDFKKHFLKTDSDEVQLPAVKANNNEVIYATSRPIITKLCLMQSRGALEAQVETIKKELLEVCVTALAHAKFAEVGEPLYKTAKQVLGNVDKVVSGEITVVDSKIEGSPAYDEPNEVGEGYGDLDTDYVPLDSFAYALVRQNSVAAASLINTLERKKVAAALEGKYDIASGGADSETLTDTQVLLDSADLEILVAGLQEIFTGDGHDFYTSLTGFGFTEEQIDAASKDSGYLKVSAEKEGDFEFDDSEGADGDGYLDVDADAWNRKFIVDQISRLNPDPHGIIAEIERTLGDVVGTYDVSPTRPIVAGTTYDLADTGTASVANTKNAAKDRVKLVWDLVQKMEAKLSDNDQAAEKDSNLVQYKKEADFFEKAQKQLATLDAADPSGKAINITDLRNNIFFALINSEVDGAEEYCNKALVALEKESKSKPPLEPALGGSSASSASDRMADLSGGAPKPPGVAHGSAVASLDVAPSSSSIVPPPSSSIAAPASSIAPPPVSSIAPPVSSAALPPLSSIAPPPVSSSSIAPPASSAAASIKIPKLMSIATAAPASAAPAPAKSSSLENALAQRDPSQYKPVHSVVRGPGATDRFSKFNDKELAELCGQLVIIGSGKNRSVKNVDPKFKDSLPKKDNDVNFAVEICRLTKLGDSGRLVTSEKHATKGIVDTSGLEPGYLRKALNAAYENVNTSSTTKGGNAKQLIEKNRVQSGAGKAS